MGSKDEVRGHGPPSVISAGLMRTGTKSMSVAYEILGLRSHHGHDLAGSLDGMQSWSIWERAAEATFAESLDIQPRPPKFTREDWDKIYGNFDATTDVGAHFAEELIRVYPDAKVVIVQRDYDKWWASFEVGVAAPLHMPGFGTVMGIVAWLTGIKTYSANLKILHGMFGARDLEGVRKRSREVYFGHYERIRKLVPEERRLEYKLGDGWEPLCEFLGKGVPDVPFPHVNDREEHRAMQINEMKQLLRQCWIAIRPYVIAGSVVLLAIGAVLWQKP